MEEATLDSVIERIYEAVGYADQWQAVLEELTTVIGASSGCILSSSTSNPRGNVNCFHNIDPDWIDAYNLWYYQYDPSPAVLTAAPDQVHVDAVTGTRISEATGGARIFYHEVMRPQDFRHTLHLGLTDTGDRSTGVILQRPASLGPFENRQVQALARLSSHLRGALQLHTRLQAAEGFNQALTTVLDNAPMGIILLDGTGGVLHTNARVDQVLRQSTALQADARGLYATDRREHQVLQSLVRAAVSGDCSKADSPVWLHAADGTEALQVQVKPLCLNSANDPLVPRGVRAALWIGSVSPVRLCPESLSRLYGLSRAEGELLARLVEGWQACAIAKARHASEHTVRKQIKTIMGKLNVSRQLDLVRLVLSGPPALMPRE